MAKKTSSKKKKKQRRLPSEDEIQVIVEDQENTMALDDSYKDESYQITRVFVLDDKEDNAAYHAIMNDPSRYTIVDKKMTWHRPKDELPSLVIALEYLDRFHKGQD